MSAESTTRPGFGTLAIHAGTHPDPITGAVVTPISLATTFVQKSPGEHTVSRTREGEGETKLTHGGRRAPEQKNRCSVVHPIEGDPLSPRVRPSLSFSPALTCGMRRR